MLNKFQKEVNRFKFFRVITILILIYFLIYQFDLVVSTFTIIESYLYNYISTHTLQEIAITTIVLLLMCWIFMVVFGDYFRRINLQSKVFIYNNVDEEVQRFATNSEMQNSFVEVDYNNPQTNGFLIARYCQVTFLGLKVFRIKFFTKRDSSKIMKIEQEINNLKESKATDEEINKAESKKAKINRVQNLQSYNIPYLKFIDKALVDIRPINSLVVTTSRGGKSQLILMAQIDLTLRQKDPSMRSTLVISDPKFEIYSYMAQRLINAGYEIKIVNFDNFRYSHSYNPTFLIMQKWLSLMKNFGKDFFITEVVTFNEYLRAVYLNEKTTLTEQQLADAKEELNYNDLSTPAGEMMLADYLSTNESLMQLGSITGEITDLALSLVPSSPDEDPKGSFFKTDAQKALESFVYWQLEDCFLKLNFDYFNMFNINTKLKTCLTSVEERTLMFHLKNSSNFGKKQMGSVDSINEDTTATLEGALKIFTDPGLGLATSRNQFDFQKIADGKKPYAIFLVAPDYNPRFNSIISLFITQLTTVMNQTADRNKELINESKTRNYLFDNEISTFNIFNKLDGDELNPVGKIKMLGTAYELEYKDELIINSLEGLNLLLVSKGLKIPNSIKKKFIYMPGSLKRNCFMMLEELAQFTRIPRLENQLAISLGRGIKYMLIVQNVTQLQSLYGESAMKTIFDNCHNKYYLSGGYEESRTWFSKELGDTQKINMTQQGKSRSEMSGNFSLEKVPLVSQEKLSKNWMGRVYIASLNNQAIKAYLRPFFQYVSSDILTPKYFFENGILSNLHENLCLHDIEEKHDS